jgi:hypothetical protein
MHAVASLIFPLCATAYDCTVNGVRPTLKLSVQTERLGCSLKVCDHLSMLAMRHRSSLSPRLYLPVYAELIQALMKDMRPIYMFGSWHAFMWSVERSPGFPDLLDVRTCSSGFGASLATSAGSTKTHSVFRIRRRLPSTSSPPVYLVAILTVAAVVSQRCGLVSSDHSYAVSLERAISLLLPAIEQGVWSGQSSLLELLCGNVCVDVLDRSNCRRDFYRWLYHRVCHLTQLSSNNHRLPVYTFKSG